MPHFKKLTAEKKAEIEARIKLLLHASRDCMRNQYHSLNDDYLTIRNQKLCPIPEAEKILQRHAQSKDWRSIRFSVNDGYYGDAFGILRCLELMGYGTLNNIREQTYHNLQWWFEQIKSQVLIEDGFTNGSHKCDFCVANFGKDGAGRRREYSVNS